MRACRGCMGFGSQLMESGRRERCFTCGGTGLAKPGEEASVFQPCSKCWGKRYLPDAAGKLAECQVCNGAGVIAGER